MNRTKIVLTLLMVLMMAGVSSAVSTSWGVSNTATTLSLPTVISGGSGGGSGGGGVITDEPLSNIASSDRKELDLTVDQLASYTFNLPVYRIDITPTNNENQVTAKVEILKDKPNRTEPPNYNSILFFNAYVGTKRFSSAKIYFTSDGNIPTLLLKWNPSTNQWDEIETTKIDDNHFSATTTGFSNFAIVWNELQQQPEIYKPEPEQTTSQATTLPEADQPTPESTMQTPGFAGMLAFISLLTVSLYVRRK